MKNETKLYMFAKQNAVLVIIATLIRTYRATVKLNSQDEKVDYSDTLSCLIKVFTYASLHEN